MGLKFYSNPLAWDIFTCRATTFTIKRASLKSIHEENEWLFYEKYSLNRHILFSIGFKNV